MVVSIVSLLMLLKALGWLEKEGDDDDASILNFDHFRLATLVVSGHSY